MNKEYDIALFYHDESVHIVEEVEKFLKTNRYSTYPTYEELPNDYKSEELKEDIKIAANKSKFRIFFLTAGFLKEDAKYHKHIINDLNLLDDSNTLILKFEEVRNVPRYMDRFRIISVDEDVGVEHIFDSVLEFMKGQRSPSLGREGTPDPGKDSSFDISGSTVYTPSPGRGIGNKSQNLMPSGGREGTPDPGEDSSFDDSGRTAYTADLRHRNNRQSNKNTIIEGERRLENNNMEQNSAKNSLIGFLISGALFLIVMVLFFLAFQPEITERNEKTITEKFIDGIEDLKRDSMQDKKFWRIVRATMKDHMVNLNPIQPTVLMLVSTKRSSKTREKLAKEIAQVYSVRCRDKDYVKVDSSYYSTMDQAEAKEKVDEIIETGFNSGSCAAVVSNFQQLPPATTKVFYQFCENDLAPFKKVAVIFTLEIEPGSWDTDDLLPTIEANPEPHLWDSIVDAYLHHSLRTRDDTGTMKRDMIAPLLTRITPAVVWVKDEL